MAKKESNKLILWQGDKKTLEDMTGEKYKYINSEEINDLDHFGKSEYSCVTLVRYEESGISYRAVRCTIEDQVGLLDADALIYYDEGCCSTVKEDEMGSIIERPSLRYAQGTPVRKTKK